jgi:signal transduction histidine kinase/CheY-like chemotaxis protein/HPt (histidine-containing phosphotransfer) domain-containing protein
MRNEMVHFITAIGKTLVRAGPTQPLLQHVAEEIVARLDVALLRIWTLNSTTDKLELRATAGSATPPNEPHDSIDLGEEGIGRIASDMRMYVVNSVVNDPRVGERSWLMGEGIVAFGGYPLIVERRLLGIMATHWSYPLTDEVRDALASVADQIAVVIDYRRALNELEAAKREVLATETTKAQFLANMSHELRTPLSAIVGVATLLVDTSLTKEQRQHADIIRISGDALLGLINDMFDLSKMGNIKLDDQAFDLHACIEETLDLLAPQAMHKRLELSYSIDPKTPQRIFGDATRLRQVLMNLLANAIKFTRVGDVSVNVTTQARELGFVEIKFAIRDTGIGIAAARLQRMFNPFGQTDAIANQKSGGTHLGLAICKRLCEAMNATIDVHSELDKGTTFTVTLVARAAATEPLPHLRVAQPRLLGRRVLIVDDNGTTRRNLRDQFSTWGMVPVVAASQAEALELMTQEEPFELAVVDVNLSNEISINMTGELQRIHLTFAALPTILLASLADHAALSARRGPMSLVTKPIKPGQLYNAVFEALSETTPRPGSKQTPPATASQIARVPLKILLVEDYVINQQVASMMLERLGYQCDIVPNGIEALVALRRGSYDVVFMDVQMPIMDGFETTRIIWREWEPHERPYIVALTAAAMPGDRERCLDAGMDHYIAKPVRVDELRAALEMAASRVAGRKKFDSEWPADVFDPRPLEQLRQLGAQGDSGIANEIVQSFCIDTPRRIATLRIALESRDLKQVELIAHSLKSGSGTVGARQLASLFASIEDKAEAGDLDAVARLAQELDRTFASAREALENAMVIQDRPSTVGI